MPMTRQPWRYKKVNVYPAGLNGSGIRWYANHPSLGFALRADTKESMRQLINQYLYPEYFNS